MIAHLPMYERPETIGAHDRYWHLIRQALGHSPPNLSRNLDLWQTWRSPDLLLSQTCGLPFRAALHGDVTLVGTPDYGLPGCPPGTYRSIIITRPETDLAAGPLTAAYNEALSQSGWAALVQFLTDTSLSLAGAIPTGAHYASAQAVLSGQADLAAIDAVTWRILQAYEPWTRELTVAAETPPTPGLPYITARGRDPGPLRAAIARAITQLDPADRAALHLTGLVMLSPDAYTALPIPPEP